MTPACAPCGARAAMAPRCTDRAVARPAARPAATRIRRRRSARLRALPSCTHALPQILADARTVAFDTMNRPLTPAARPVPRVPRRAAGAEPRHRVRAASRRVRRLPRQPAGPAAGLVHARIVPCQLAQREASTPWRALGGPGITCHQPHGWRVAAAGTRKAAEPRSRSRALITKEDYSARSSSRTSRP